MLPSAQGEVVGVLGGSFRSSVPSPPIPLFMLRGTPHDVPRKTRGRADRYSLLVKLFHLLLPIGLSRRTPLPAAELPGFIGRPSLSATPYGPACLSRVAS